MIEFSGTSDGDVETHNYVADVEAAPYHLLHLLHPEDTFIKKVYDFMLRSRMNATNRTNTKANRNTRQCLE